MGICRPARTSASRRGSGYRVASTLKHHRSALAAVALAGAVLLATTACGPAHATGPAHRPHEQGAASGIPPVTPSPRSTPIVNITCGAAGQPACAFAASTPPEWIPIKSEAPGDILAAARQSPLFIVDRSGNGDYLQDLSRLGAPTLVRGLHTPSSVTAPDFYVIAIQNPSGAAIGAAELELNTSRTAIHVAAITTYGTPHANGAIPRMSVSDALKAVATQAHTTLRTNAQPELIYFPIDAFAQQHGQIAWTDGGAYPADPIWLIPGADGQEYVVGVDARVYRPTDLPIATAHGTTNG